jgi:hypothetical protein
MSEKIPTTKPKKASSVRHTRAIQRDRSKRAVSAPADEQIVQRLSELVQPATLAQVAYYQQLGLRSRVLTLPVMMALVLSLIWQQTGSVSELARLVHSECVLWVPPLVEITQQALASRLRTLPAALFLRVLLTVLPVLKQRWHERKRPVPAEIAWAQRHYTAVLACDGSTLDALLRKVGLLRETEKPPLAGRMFALLNIVTRLPEAIWYTPEAQAHDQSFLPELWTSLPAQALLLFDLGFTNFTFFRQLTERKVCFITRAKSNLAYQVERVLLATPAVHERLVWIGTAEDRQSVRLLEVLYQGKWYRYLTNELDPARLPVPYAVALYWQRWRIEDAFNIVKRLLGLAFFYCGAENAVQMQLWATWLLYAVLVDLTDAVAEALNQPFARVSMEMVYRSLYFFTQAHHRGETADVVAFFAKKAKELGILKRKRHDKPSIFLSLNLTLAQKA